MKPEEVPGGTPCPIAHSGAGASSARSTPMPRAAAARTIVSNGAQIAAGYAAGSAALKPAGRVCDVEPGSLGPTA